MAVIGYIISAVSSLKPNEVRYYSIDSYGYPLWSWGIRDAKHFKSQEDAEKVLDGCEFVKDNERGDMVYPPSMIHKGSGVNHDNPAAGLMIEIIPLRVDAAVDARAYHAKIEKKSDRDRDIRERALEKLKGVLSAEELAAFGFKAEPEKVWARGGC